MMEKPVKNLKVENTVRLATLAGQILIENGAEVNRAEDTMSRILNTTGIEYIEVYVTRTGLFLSLDDKEEIHRTLVKRVGSSGTNLYKIISVNKISRLFCSGEISDEEAFLSMIEADKENYPYPRIRDLAEVFIGACFVPLIDFSFANMLSCLFAGLSTMIIRKVCEKLKLNVFIKTSLQTFCLYSTAFLINKFFFSINVDSVVISALMPLLPGSALTTAIRDTLQGDYLAGTAKLLETIIKAFSLVTGVGAAIFILGG